MAKISFNTICFKESDKESDNNIKIQFMNIFSAPINKEKLNHIGTWKIENNDLYFQNVPEKKLSNKFHIILNTAMNNLRNNLTGNPAVYIHQNSGIPLIGSLEFGIVDRGTNIIEVKPITGCNLNCIFCSVNENKKSVDFVLEKDYIIKELKKLIDFKIRKDPKIADKGIDICINPHGEPTLYSDLANLILDLKKICEVNKVILITNGTMLTKKIKEDLINAGLDQINISLHAIDENKSKTLSENKNYSSKQITDNIKELSEKITVIVAPVWIKNVNDIEVEKIIDFIKQLNTARKDNKKKIKIGIQNYLAHKKGRKISKQVSWDEFYEQISIWEKKKNISLKFDLHSLFKTPSLPKPFKKDDVIDAEIFCNGRKNKESIACSKDRCITVLNPNKKQGRIKIKIVRDKDNIFLGEAI